MNESGGSDRARALVLVVDDESALRAVTMRLVETLGCDVDTAPSGFAAVELLTRGPAVVFLDMTAPGSEELYSIASQHEPPIPVVLASGCATEQMRARFPGHPTELMLAKPFGRAELDRVLTPFLRQGSEGA